MASFKQPSVDAGPNPVEDDLFALADINQSLRDQVVSLLLEVTMLREHMERQNDRHQTALLPTRH
jgi:hypothetical protein